ncbi:hypothetical protein JCM10213v2_002131 [Rhodosporidiobolus nylandii]
MQHTPELPPALSAPVNPPSSPPSTLHTARLLGLPLEIVSLVLEHLPNPISTFQAVLSLAHVSRSFRAAFLPLVFAFLVIQNRSAQAGVKTLLRGVPVSTVFPKRLFVRYFAGELGVVLPLLRALKAKSGSQRGVRELRMVGFIDSAFLESEEVCELSTLDLTLRLPSHFPRPLNCPEYIDEPPSLPRTFSLLTNLTITTTDPCLPTLTCFAACALPSLQRLSLTTSSYSPVDSDIVSPFAQLVAPQLHELELDVSLEEPGKVVSSILAACGARLRHVSIVIADEGPDGPSYDLVPLVQAAVALEDLEELVVEGLPVDAEDARIVVHQLESADAAGEMQVKVRLEDDEAVRTCNEAVADEGRGADVLELLR